MEEGRNCIYCNEIMRYGQQTQILCKSIMKDGKLINKSVKFQQYGWKCQMTDDNCDILFDEEDTDTNKQLKNNAVKYLLKYSSIE